MRTHSRLLLATCLLFLPTALMAHAHLQSADPADGAELDHAPEKIELRFSEGIEARFSTFALHLVPSPDTADVEDHPQVPLGDPGADAEERIVTLHAETDIEPGTYVLVWEVLAHDGHTTTGEVRFTVAE